MKKTIITAIAALLLLAGCQQAQEAQQKAAATINEASKQLDSAKAQVIQTKEKIDEKVSQAQAAATAVNKLTQ
jgi:outer membrane lipoprotein-sorting protein